MGVISLDLQQTDAGYDVKKEIERLDKEIDDEVAARVAADTSIWEEIETIEAASDVVDVVGTYEALENYDTSKLQDNDLIKVLQDETRDGAITYYRWNKTSSAFAYVGSEGPYYTASETDTLLAAKQDTLIAGTNITIAADGKTISATDTTYTSFTGATASEDGAQGLVPAPSAGDEDKVLKGDGTWGDAGSTYSAGTGIDITNNTISVDNTVATQTDLAGKQDTLTAGANITISGTTISATDTTYSDFTGATSSVAGTHGLVPAPTTSDADNFLKGDGTWATVQGGGLHSVFYYDGTSHFYKDAGLTDSATAQDILEAIESGTTFIKFPDNATGIDDKYIQVISYRADNTNRLSIQGVACLNSTNKEGAYIRFTQYANEERWNLARTGIQSKLTAGSNITISGSTISARDTTYSAFGGATSQVAGSAGLVPAPAIGDDTKYLKGDGTWAAVQSGAQLAVFYIANDLASYSVNDTFPVYKDSSLTSEATADEFFTAAMEGEVRLVYGGSVWHIKYLWDDDSNYGDDDANNYQVFSPILYESFQIAWTGSGPQRSSTPAQRPTVVGRYYYQPSLTAGSNISIDSSTSTISVTGMPALYTTTGQNTDGAVTQKLFTDTVGNIESALQILNSGAGVP